MGLATNFPATLRTALAKVNPIQSRRSSAWLRKVETGPFLDMPASHGRFNHTHLNGSEALSMTEKLSAGLALVCWGLISGCAALVIATGAGTGAYTYVNGELVRSYPAPYSQTMDVCTQILKDLDMPIREQTSDGVRTTLVTERKDGTPMTLKITIVGLDVTEVSVRTGTVGYWNRDLSQQFHDFISRRLAP